MGEKHVAFPQVLLNVGDRGATRGSGPADVGEPLLGTSGLQPRLGPSWDSSLPFPPVSLWERPTLKVNGCQPEARSPALATGSPSSPALQDLKH